jgi:hypothetical protein
VYLSPTRRGIVNFDRRYYLVLALGYAVIWMCLGIVMIISDRLAEGAKQWLHWYRQKKGLR